MTAAPSKHPSNWKLWHPNHGILFQQPFYPNLDFARFSTEASAAETRHEAPGVSMSMRPATAQQSEETEHFARVDAPTQDETKNPTTTTAGENSRDAPADADLSEAGLDNVEEPIIDVPPFTPLEFTIPEEVFRNAKAANTGSTGSFWSHDLYRGPKGTEQWGEAARRVQVRYCKNPKTAEEALQHLLGEQCLGLDLEWVPHAHKNAGVRRNVSLVQLASPSRVVLLHLALYPRADEQFATPTLRKILEDPAVSKTGVAIKGDCARLEKYLGIKVQGMFELSHLFNQVTHLAKGKPELVNKKMVSLARQVYETTGLPLSKDQNVRSSNWSRPLNVKQVAYSASDAYAGVQIYAMLNHKRQELDPVPDLPFHAELDRPIPLPPGLQVPILDVEKAVSDGAETEADGKLEPTVWVFEDVGAAINHQSVDPNTTIAEDVMVSPPEPAPKQKAKAPTTKLSRGPVNPTDPRIVAAETSQSQFISTRKGGKPKAQAAKLRAYFLWYANEDLNPEGMSQMLRIQPRTVVTYILDAVIQERLPYDKFRLQAEVVGHVPRDLLQMRYPSIWRATKDIC